MGVIGIIFMAAFIFLAFDCITKGNYAAAIISLVFAGLIFAWYQKRRKKKPSAPKAPKSAEQPVVSSEPYRSLNSKGSTLEDNAGCPFSYEIPQIAYDGTPVAYKYQDVLCTICGDVEGMKPGSVVYTGYNGEVKNSLHFQVAHIDNTKISEMINDYLTRGDIITARTFAIDSKLHINIGFYRDFNIPENNNIEED